MAELPTTSGAQPGAQSAPGASREQLEAFLASAPDELKAWAQQQLDDLGSEPVPAPADSDEAVGLEAVLDDADLEPEPVRPVAAGPSADKPRSGVAGVNKLLVVALVAAIVIAIYAVGNNRASSPTASPSASMPVATTSALDQAMVTGLKKKVADNPADIESLRELGRLYYEAGEYQEAAGWQQKIVDQRPDDLDALLALGVAHFNSGNLELAEKSWTKAADVAPDRAAPHYNLGFLYLSKTPPDYDRMRQEWARVVALEPESEMAKTVQGHLGRLSNESPSASRSGG